MRQGTSAEDDAARYLIGLGFTIVTRRFKAPHGELDLVALDGDELVFVEVKATNLRDRSAELAIDERKIDSLMRAAAYYVATTEQTSRATRFDVITVSPGGITHFRNAFSP
jgi:putative endonuclease